MNDAMMNNEMMNNETGHATENRIAKLEQIMKAKQNIWRAFSELSLLGLNDLTGECDDMITEEYPFSESLSDINIQAWVESTRKELRAYEIVKRVMDFMNVSNHFNSVKLDWVKVEELCECDEWDRVNMVRNILLDSVPALYQLLK